MQLVKNYPVKDSSYLLDFTEPYGYTSLSFSVYRTLKICLSNELWGIYDPKIITQVMEQYHG